VSDVSGFMARTGGFRARSAAVAVLVWAGVSGCTGGAAAPQAPAGTYTAPVSVIQPGRPGEPATHVAPGQTAERPRDASWNGADLYFVSMMVLHHTQALRLARLADGRTSNPQVTAVAERVLAAQAPEILTLKAWLAARQQKLPDSAANDGHAHGGMPGAVTPARMEALARTGGPAFDRLFLDLMVAHHAGAVQMASTVTTAGNDLAVQEIAAETAVGQNAEIRRMEKVRAGL
jgi:uncharacterized protein (DUF305 family)